MNTLLQELASFLFGYHCTLCEEVTESTLLCERCTADLTVLVAGHRCCRCDEPIAEGEICDLCIFSESPFRYLRSPWRYTATAKNLIHEIKYNRNEQLCSVIGKHIGNNLTQIFPAPDWDLIIPVPLSKERLALRGFNQCALLTHQIAATLGRSFTRKERTTLTCIKDRPIQSALPTKKRIKNVANVFQSRFTFADAPTILLVDDVLTTGATASEAARTLLAAGAAHIDLLTVTRSEHWNTHRRAVELALRKKLK